MGYSGYISNGIEVLNDVWVYKVIDEEWEWIGGSNRTLGLGENGNLREWEREEECVINGREKMGCSCNEKMGILSIFGGESNWNRLRNDLWMFDRNNKKWRREYGDLNVYNQFSTLTTKGNIAIPSGRIGFVFEEFDDLSKKYILWGGTGRDDDESTFAMNDLFIYNSLQHEFYWMHGDKDFRNGVLSISDVKGEYSVNNKPCIRVDSASYKVNKDTMAIYGGRGEGISYVQSGPLGDLWFYNITLNQFSFQFGSLNKNFQGIYPPLDGEGKYLQIYNESLIPKSRRWPGLYIHDNRFVWIFGGSHGFSTNVLNDFWIYDIEKNQSMLINGYNYYNQYTLFGYDYVVDEYGPVDTEVRIGSNKHMIGAGFYSTEFDNDFFIFFGGSIRLEHDETSYSHNIWMTRQKFSCFGKLETDKTSCNGTLSGICYKNDYCKCNENKFGRECNINICFDVFSNITSKVCSGKKGECIGYNHCKCFNTKKLNLNVTNYGKNCESNDFIERYGTYIFVPTGIIVVVLIIGLIIFLAMLFIICLRKKLKKYKLIDDDEFEILLEEYQVQEESNTKVKLNIDTKLFEIKLEDVELIRSYDEREESDSVEAHLVKWKGMIVMFHSLKPAFQLLSQGFIDEFQKEISLFASLRYKFILKFIGVILRPPKIGYVVEHCENGTLKGYVEKFMKENDDIQFPLIEKIRILQEISSGMRYLNSLNIIHRNLNCMNVLLTKTNTSKLTNFTFSRILITDVVRTRLIGKGTYNIYVAPEIIMALNNYTEKCDVYSFGIIIYTLITENWNPFDTKKGGGFKFEKIMDDNYRPKFSSEMFDDKKWLIQLMQNCWQTNQSNRKSFNEIFTIIKGNLDKIREDLALIKIEGKTLKTERIGRDSRINKTDGLEKIKNELKKVNIEIIGENVKQSVLLKRKEDLERKFKELT